MAPGSLIINLKHHRRNQQVERQQRSKCFAGVRQVVPQVAPLLQRGQPQQVALVCPPLHGRRQRNRR